jgi:hypothetical protein
VDWVILGTPALIKAKSDHCKTVEFAMKACWEEDAQAVASEPQEEMAIESSAQFSSFHNSLIKKYLCNVNFCGIGR